MAEFRVIFTAHMRPKGYPAAALRLPWVDFAAVPQALKGSAEHCVCWGFVHEQKNYLSNSLNDVGADAACEVKKQTRVM